MLINGKEHKIKPCADLGGANLRSANLYGANLRSANLRSADLYGANLYGANLRSADLRSADLYGANLYGANLYGADLRSANLYGANLRSASLYGANLYGANLRSANLYGADLYGADLYGADLYGANLRSANIENAVLPHFQICPSEGSFVAWKKVHGAILKLEIQGARTSNLVGRKCRTDQAKVLAAFTLDRKRVFRVADYSSMHDSNFKYRVGKVVKADLDADIRVECTSGIHFFMTRAEAEAF